MGHKAPPAGWVVLAVTTPRRERVSRGQATCRQSSWTHRPTELSASLPVPGILNWKVALAARGVQGQTGDGKLPLPPSLPGAVSTQLTRQFLCYLWKEGEEFRGIVLSG